jgi:hypothetical protein
MHAACFLLYTLGVIVDQFFYFFASPSAYYISVMIAGIFQFVS